MAEKKAVCGGFYIGDGLEMDGKTLKATGGSGDIKIYTASSDVNGITVQDAGNDIDTIYKTGRLCFDVGGNVFVMECVGKDGGVYSFCMQSVDFLGLKVMRMYYSGAKKDETNLFIRFVGAEVATLSA